MCVPGQRFWHTHQCPNCQSTWTHIAPTPMTQAKNREIHTCTKCGTEVYTFVGIDEGPDLTGVAWLGAGLLLGLAGAALFNQRR